MRIITVSREFGSGGRELGKRIADNLGCDYYDREILTMIAEKHGLTEEYVEDMLKNWLSADCDLPANDDEVVSAEFNGQKLEAKVFEDIVLEFMR